jgi:hypothetical protein
MKQTTMLYLGAVGAILAVLGGLGAQTIARGVASSTANLSSAFVPGGDTGEMADKLEDALPEIRDSIRKATPYAFLQFGGYLLFSLGFVGIWLLTRRGITLASAICFALFAIVTLASLLILPQAMEELVSLLRGLSEDEELTTVPMSLLLLGGAGLLSLVLQLGGSIAGGWETYRIGKELDHDFLRGSGALLMAGAIAAFVPVYGVLILLLAVAAVGIGFYLLATRVEDVLVTGKSQGHS